MDRNELKARQEHPQTPAIDLIVISLIANAIREGDPKRLDYLATWIVGKPPQLVEEVKTVQDDDPLVAPITKEQALAILQRRRDVS